MTISRPLDREVGGEAAPPPPRRTDAVPKAVVRSTGRLFQAWLPALPLIVFATTLLVLPAVKIVHDTFALRDGSYGLDNIERVISNPVDRRAILASFELSLLQATIVAAFGAPVAWLISRMRMVRRTAWISLVSITAHSGGIGLVFAFIALIGTQGMLTLGLAALGIGNPFPATNSFGGFSMVYLYTNLPLFILLVLPAMAVLRDDWWEAAQTAHASRMQFWRHVGVPILGPFIVANWILIFTWTMGVYSLAYALASGPNALRVLTLQIGSTLESSVFGLGRAAVLSVLLMIVALAGMGLYSLAIRRATRWL